MASILTPLVKHGWVRNYLDDLILWAPDFPELELLSSVIELSTLLTDHGVKRNLSKCSFGFKEVTFLGQEIFAAGSKADLRISRRWEE